MDTKIIICIDCGCEVIVKKRDGRTKRCKKHQKEFNKKYQIEYQKDYFKENRQSNNLPYKRTYKRRYVNTLTEVDYCKENSNKVDGCLNCICSECIQPVDNDSFLPWERVEHFFEDKFKNKEKKIL